MYPTFRSRQGTLARLARDVVARGENDASDLIAESHANAVSRRRTTSILHSIVEQGGHRLVLASVVGHDQRADLHQMRKKRHSTDLACLFRVQLMREVEGRDEARRQRLCAHRDCRSAIRASVQVASRPLLNALVAG